MYVRRNELSEKKKFPINYNGSLLYNSLDDQSDCCPEARHVVKYRIKKNKFIPCTKKSLFDLNGNNDDLILIGALAFLYIGCEHTKDNLILMAIIAYLLFFAKNN